MTKVMKYALLDLLRSRVVLGYAVSLLAVSWGLFQLESDSSKALLSLINVVLVIVPLLCTVFTVTYSYNAQEFTELLLVQPIPRSHIILGQMAAVAVALEASFVLGVGLPLALFAQEWAAVTLAMSGILLTLVFVALAFAIAVRLRDKAKGVGAALLAWFYFALLYDGLLLLFLFLFYDYPIEKWVLPLASLNPVDLARILVLLHVDLSALMGYSGAVYKQFFGSALGIAYTSALMLVWIFIPAWAALRTFKRKDF
jgi:Cu-processing system permease protein